jgi:hypothetical protein
VDKEKVLKTPFSRRTTIQGLSYAIDVPSTTCFRRVKEGTLKHRTSAVKPLEMERTRILRLSWCLSMVDSTTIRGTPHFQDMYNIVHIDEKWFYMTRQSEGYYMLAGENLPHRQVQSKRFVTKVMFLAAVARPRFDVNRNCTFDGKIGIFPLIEKEEAKRKS